MFGRTHGYFRAVRHHQLYLGLGLVACVRVPVLELADHFQRAFPNVVAEGLRCHIEVRHDQAMRALLVAFEEADTCSNSNSNSSRITLGS